MRAAAALVVLAAAASAKPVLWATGETLQAFDVQVDLAAIEHSSPRALAESFAELHVGQHRVARRFAELFEAAHVAILERYYTEGLAKKQAAAYRALPLEETALACTVAEVAEAGEGFAVVLLDRSWRDAKGEARTRRLRLSMAAKGEFWWLRKVEHDLEGKGFVDQGLGAPPAVLSVPIPEAGTPDQTGPDAAVASLEREMRRLAALGQRGRHSLYRHFYPLVRACYGDEVAKVAEEAQVPSLPGLPLSYERAEPEERLAGVVRIRVAAWQAVPGTEGQRSAVGMAAFDLRREPGATWRIVWELRWEEPEGPPVPVGSNLGLFFAR